MYNFISAVIEQSITAVNVVLFSLYNLTTSSDALEQEPTLHTTFRKNAKGHLTSQDGLEHLSANIERWIIEFSVRQWRKTSVITP